VGRRPDAHRRGLYVTLNALLPGKVAVWTTDHDKGCKKPTKVFNPTARFSKDDLKDYAVAIVTHKMFGGKQGHKARQALQEGQLRPRVLTVVDEQPDEVVVYEVDMAAAERGRELVKAHAALAGTVGPHMDALVRFMHPRTFVEGCVSYGPVWPPSITRAAKSSLAGPTDAVEIKVRIANALDRFGHLRRPVARKDVLGAVASTHSTARVPGDCVVQVLLHFRLSERVLRIVSERVKDLAFIGDPERPEVAPPPLRERRSTIRPWSDEGK
jgi:hypothetical protein